VNGLDNRYGAKLHFSRNDTRSQKRLAPTIGAALAAKPLVLARPVSGLPNPQQHRPSTTQLAR
jgi:hypothetical protein